MRKRIVITGMSMITPFGGSEETMKAIYANRSAIGTLPEEYDICPTRIGGRIGDNIDLSAWIKAPKALKIARRGGRGTKYACSVTYRALEQAGVLGDDGALLPHLKDRAGVAIGTDWGDFEIMNNMAVQMYRIEQASGEEREALTQQLFKRHTFSAHTALPDSIPTSIAQAFGMQRDADCTVKACATGPGSIRRAAMSIQHGIVDMIVAGSSSILTPPAMMTFNTLGTRDVKRIQGALSKRNDEPENASRPFDKDRDGFVISEGAAVFVIESAEHAMARGATPIAELIGHGETTDITSPTDPDADSQARAISEAMAMAGICSEDIDLVKDHATATTAGDIVAARVLKRTFGERRVPIIAPKCWLGHMLAASGSVETAIALKIMETGKIPAMRNLDNPIDEALICSNDSHAHTDECYLNFPRKPIKANIETVLCTSYGFGGQNVPLIFKKWSE
ncbi:MAG: beta-ketoacyl-[acyl-carrier-protein] synthase family protein [Chloroflexi bacterium]|nr:beta-ketoacyl-[acyl-carrier-protein] synthase family protein [Chloroflexota bacterium]